MDFYRIRKLGRGVFSDVYLIKDSSDEKLYCQKVIKPRYLEHIENEKKILSVLKKINHPCIIKFYHEEVMYNSTSLIFEYMFLNLYNFYKQYEEHINYYSICDYTWQITNALQCIHKLFIVHCDLKPENIMINTNFTKVKIIDFGSSIINHQKKNTHFYIVSRFYRAPELTLKSSYDEKIDIWSLGCIVYELITKKPLFFSSNTQEHNVNMRDYYYSKNFNIINKVISTNSMIYIELDAENQLKLLNFLCFSLKFDKNERYSASQLLGLKLFESFI